MERKNYPKEHALSREKKNPQQEMLVISSARDAMVRDSILLLWLRIAIFLRHLWGTSVAGSDIQIAG